MDKESTIIAIGIIVATILPFIIFKLIRKMQKVKFHKNFTKLAAREKLNFSHTEILNKCYAIGIDPDSKKLLYLNNREGQNEMALIELSEVNKCRLITTDRHLKSENDSSDHSNKLELVFTFTNSKSSEKILEFYNNSEFLPNPEEISQIENWLNIINSNIQPVGFVTSKLA
jgi:hypothetical protein